MSKSNPKPGDVRPDAAVAEKAAEKTVEKPTTAPGDTNGNGADEAQHAPTRAEAPAPSRRRNGLRTLPPKKRDRDTPSQRVAALFCHEPPESDIGQYVGRLAVELAKRDL